MPAHIRLKMSKDLNFNWALSQKLLIIEEAARRLDKSMVSPDDSVIKRIMAYAGSTLANVSVSGR
jgi:hypothetical protein